MCYVQFIEQAATFLHGVRKLVFITETVCVYLAVPTESLYKTGTLRLKSM